MRAHLTKHRSMKLDTLDLLYQVLTSPSSAFQSLAERKPVAQAVAVAVATSAIFALVVLPYPPRLVENIVGLERGALGSPALWLVWLSFFPVLLLIEAGLVRLAAASLGGRGSYRGLFCGLCFASFPLVLFAPAALLRAMVDAIWGQSVYYFCSVVLALWILWLSVLATRQTERLALHRAIIACLIPLFVVIIAPLVAVVLCTAV